MKRDMDLIRELLLRVESMKFDAGAKYAFSVHEDTLGVAEFTPDEVAYNLTLMVEAGLISYWDDWQPNFIPITGMTWQGHDFLDSVRDDEIWRRTKEGASKAGGFTIELLGDLAKGLIKTQIEKHTGVKL